MNQQAENAVTEMLNGFAQTSQDYQVLFSTLEKLCNGIDDAAVIAAAECFADGRVPGQSKTYAPSSATFMDEVRRQQERIYLRAQKRLPPPTYRRGALAPFEIKRQKAMNEYADCPVLFEDVNLDMFKRLSQERKIPVGGKWVASLGIIVGPKPA